MNYSKLFIVGLAVIALLNTALSTAGFAQQQPSEEEQKMMKLWMEYAAPGANHKHLEAFVGDWQVEGKSWMKPGAEPSLSKTDIKAEMILQGRYLKAYYTGNMMGMPYEGVMIVGFDNYKKQFLTLWIDNTGTGFYLTSGTLDQTGKIRTETGEMDDFMTGEKSHVKTVTTIIDQDKYLFEMFMVDIAAKKEFKSLEMTAARKK